MLKSSVDLNTGHHRRVTLVTAPLIIALHPDLNLCALWVMSWYQGYFRWATFAHSQHGNADDIHDPVPKPGRVILAHTKLHIYLFQFVLLTQRK